MVGSRRRMVESGSVAFLPCAKEIVRAADTVGQSVRERRAIPGENDAGAREELGSIGPCVRAQCGNVKWCSDELPGLAQTSLWRLGEFLEAT